MRAFFEVHLRLVVTVWIILMSVLGLLYLMNYMKFDSVMSNVVSSKLDVISSSLKTSMERVDRMGIPFESADNLKDQFNHARTRESDVTAISLVNQNGELLIHSSSTQGTNVPPEVLRRALTSNEVHWSYNNDAQLYSGLQTFDSFGNLSGSIVIEYDKSALFGVYALVKLHLLEATVVIFLITALIVFLVVRLGFGDVAGVIDLIQKYSKGDKQLLDKAPPGTMSQTFADQIKQSEKMKAEVSAELERLKELSKKQEKQDTEVIK
ncbi:hypothetical protein VFDL14_21755 [Vibrio fortis]|uniref:Uncharacterized protein n=2 Tax=Vibrio fortis TaxID=212667 RepID=A0A066UKB1_9VIBR|nr:hypothetical protein VFDL14_21755 [Vibrio fortis]